MPVLMIVFFVLAGEPRMVEVEVKGMQECAMAGAPLAKSLDAVGICLDKFTGEVALWGSRPEGTAEPPPQEQAH